MATETTAAIRYGSLIGQRDQQFGKFLGNLQTFISGLPTDRQAIGNSLASINALVGTSADLPTQAPPALKTDVAQLGQQPGGGKDDPMAP